MFINSVSELIKKNVRKNNSLIIDIPLYIYLISIFPRLLGFGIPLLDSFHHGESFAAAVNIWHRSKVIPNTIHGGLDFIPALAARFLNNGDNYFYPTIYLTIILSILTGLLLVLLLRKICDESNNLTKTIFLCGASISAPYLVNYKELLLIATLFTLYRYFKSSSNNEKNLNFILLTLTTSFGCLWSFDRGLAGLFSVTLGLLVRSYLKKEIKYIKPPLVLLLSTLTLILIAKLFGVINYFENISFLVQSSGQWNYPWGLLTLSGAIFLTIYVSLCILITGKKYFINSSPEIKSFWVAMSFCSLIMLRIAINRIDIGHAYAALWIPLITSAFLFKNQKLYESKVNIFLPVISSFIGLFIFKFSEKNPFSFLGFNIYFLIFYLVTSTTLLVWFATSNKFTRLPKILSFISCLVLSLLFLVNLNQYRSLLASKFPPAGFITPIQFLKRGITYSEIFPNTNWVTNEILNSNSECLLDMTNSGTINAGVDLPSCFSIPYPVYATSKFEKRLIAEAEKSKVNKIVYSTKYWYYRIDGKDMISRFPKLDQYLVKKFPFEECEENYCVRSKTSLDYNGLDK